MPRNGSGTYTVPITYTPNTLASAADVNSNFTDIAAAMTGSLPRDGQAGMSGQIKAADGALATPGIAFDQDQDTGIRRSAANTLRLVCGGVDILEISSAGLSALSGAIVVSGTVQVGSGMDYWGTTAPAGWLFAYGQNVSRTTYAALWAALGSPNTGDGSTTFTMPDKRGRASFGKDNMGGTSANRITNQSGGWDGDVLGASGGSETHTLTIAQMASHNHGGATGFSNPIADARYLYDNNTASVSGGPNFTVPQRSSSNIALTGSLDHQHTINSEGGGLPHNNLPPGITCNYIIFAGA